MKIQGERGDGSRAAGRFNKAEVRSGVGRVGDEKNMVRAKVLDLNAQIGEIGME